MVLNVMCYFFETRCIYRCSDVLRTPLNYTHAHTPRYRFYQIARDIREGIDRCLGFQGVDIDTLRTLYLRDRWPVMPTAR